MAKTIYKYEVPITDSFDLELPKDAQILSVQTQHDRTYIWCLVETNNRKVPVHFELRGTGHDCTNLESLKYVGTFQLRNGALVFHLFSEP